MKKLGMHFALLLAASMLGGLSPSLAAEGLENHARIADTARAYIASRHPWQQMKTKITPEQNLHAAQSSSKHFCQLAQKLSAVPPSGYAVPVQNRGKFIYPSPLKPLRR